MSQLTEQQIESLYKFTRQHFVEYYDLQTELVDHMANGIEQQWNEHPTLSFEQARDREFKKFGVFGFMEVLEERQKAMQKNYGRLVLKHVKEYMRIPKIIGFALIILLTYMILKFAPIADEFFTGGIFTAGLLYLTSIIVRRRIIKRQNFENGKKWMLRELIFSHGFLGGLFFIPIYILHGRVNDINGMYDVWVIALSFIICCYYLLFYIMAFEIPRRAEEYLEQTYPEYSITT